MALYKEIETSSGLVLSYWRITHLDIDSVANTAQITVSPYLSAQDRANGRNEVRSERLRIIVRDYDYGGTEYASRSSLDYTDFFAPAAQGDKNIYQIAYEYIKTLPAFEGATDI